MLKKILAPQLCTMPPWTYPSYCNCSARLVLPVVLLFINPRCHRLYGSLELLGHFMQLDWQRALNWAREAQNVPFHTAGGQRSAGLFPSRRWMIDVGWLQNLKTICSSKGTHSYHNTTTELTKLTELTELTVLTKLTVLTGELNAATDSFTSFLNRVKDANINRVKTGVAIKSMRRNLQKDFSKNPRSATQRSAERKVKLRKYIYFKSH